MATDVLSTVWSLAIKVKAAYDGVQGNTEQCSMLNDQVQHVVASLRALPEGTRRKTNIIEAMKSLTETLRSATDFMEGFKKKHWIQKMYYNNSNKEKFEELFEELDRVLQVCGFTLNVSCASLFFFPLFSSLLFSVQMCWCCSYCLVPAFRWRAVCNLLKRRQCPPFLFAG